MATVKGLDGQDIESYANALFRSWKLGRADKNNGVLFLIAPNQHRMRIEVGYGLEGVLTDATSKLIISNAAAPRFKAGDFDGGVSRAVADIITVLTTDSGEWKQAADSAAKRARSGDQGDPIVPLLVFLFIVVLMWKLRGVSRRTGGAWIVSSGGGGWSSGGSSGGDSGFSGGGGSSGGGGASGDW